MAEPAYTRLQVDERRRQLLDRAAELFARHSYDELSMARIAEEAGVTKALLYHYFPSKQALFVATLEQGAAELAALTEPNPALPPLEALSSSVDAFLGWIADNRLAYAKLMQGATSVPEVRELVAVVRDRTGERIVAGLATPGERTPQLRAAVHGWLWFMDGAILDWLENDDLTRAELHRLLLGTLSGALAAAAAPPAD